MRQITATEITATRQAVEHCPEVLAYAMRSLETRTARQANGSDLHADALTFLATFLPEEFRTGATEATDDQHAQKVGQGAARRALARALARHQENASRTASLDALAEADPTAVEEIAFTSTERYGFQGPRSERTDARTEATNGDRLAAAFSVVSPDRLAPLALAAQAYEAAAQAHATKAAAVRMALADGHKVTETNDRLPTLAGALALTQGVTGGRKRQALAAQITDALADITPYAAQITNDPNEATTSPAYPRTWTAPATKTRRPWTEQGKATADAQRLAERIARKAENKAHQADEQRAQASRVITRHTGRYGYPEALGYDDAPFITISTNAGARIARVDATNWTPQHTALVLADLTDTTKAPRPAGERQATHYEVTCTDGTVLTLSEQGAGYGTAPQEASPTTGQVKSGKVPVSPRKKGSASGRGPSVPATF